MIYSIWPSVRALVDSAMKAPDFDAVKEKFGDQGDGIVSEARSDWNRFTNSTSEFSGKRGTKGVVEDYEGPHEYEAKITDGIEKQIASDEFFERKFSFVNRQTCGQRVDIPRFLAGDQRCWFATRKRRRKRLAVRVFAPIGGTSEVSSEMMAVCGALTCAVVEMLEAEGIAVELWAACCSEDVFCKIDYNQTVGRRDLDICQMVKLKDSSEYTDYGMVNYVTGNSQFYRNIMFKDRVKAGVNAAMCDGKFTYSGVGGSYDIAKKFLPTDESYDAKNDIIINRKYSIDAARKYIELMFKDGAANAVGETSVYEEGR